jgi:hypothetical protein
MNFSERTSSALWILLSTVTRFTEGLLKNNFDHLFGPGNTLNDLPGR